jgi:hypothetical protein
MYAANVYFQPPASLEIKYPCIIYERDSGDTVYADNNPYIHRTRYQVKVVDRDPDSEIPGKIAMLPLCRFDRHYVTDNLNHDIFNIYY